jgi:DNA-binding NarL/FixJ family response regulator
VLWGPSFAFRRHFAMGPAPNVVPGQRRSAIDQRGREVLGLIAEGRTNAGIAKHLWLTEKTIETHVSSILSKLGLSHSAQGHRRVLAVLAHLRAHG